MQGHSAAFEDVVRRSHIAVSRVDVIQDQKVVAHLAVHSGSVTADRTAAQMRSFDVEVSDPSGELTPEGMTSLLAPFGRRLQLYRGVRISNVETAGASYGGGGQAWTPQTATGVMNGVTIAANGDLVLGP